MATLVRVLKKKVAGVGPGGEVTISDRHARLLSTLKVVEIVTPPPAKTPAAAKTAKPAKSQKAAAYRTRDMVAEEPVTPNPTEAGIGNVTEPVTSVPFDPNVQSTPTQQNTPPAEAPKAGE